MVIHCEVTETVNAGVQDQVGMGFEQPAPVGGIPAHGRAGTLELDGL